MAGVPAGGAMRRRRRRLACDIYVPSLFRSCIISSPPPAGFPSQAPYSSYHKRCLPTALMCTVQAAPVPPGFSNATGIHNDRTSCCCYYTQRMIPEFLLSVASNPLMPILFLLLSHETISVFIIILVIL